MKTDQCAACMTATTCVQSRAGAAIVTGISARSARRSIAVDVKKARKSLCSVPDTRSRRHLDFYSEFLRETECQKVCR